MNTIFPYIPLLLQGAAATIATWCIASILSLAIGMILGIKGCRYLASPSTRFFIKIYTFIAKGIPAYVQILIVYFVIPSLLKISISGFAAATIALAFCSSGYTTEIIRSGINNIAPGQWDAARTLGYSLPQTLIRIIIPQAMAQALPALLGEIEQLLKSTSLLATIGVMELTRAGMNIISRELNPLPIYLMIACTYLLFSAILQVISFSMEKRTRYGFR